MDAFTKRRFNGERKAHVPDDDDDDDDDDGCKLLQRAAIRTGSVLPVLHMSCTSYTTVSVTTDTREVTQPLGRICI
jgi:hypothetical protein